MQKEQQPFHCQHSQQLLCRGEDTIRWEVLWVIRTGVALRTLFQAKWSEFAKYSQQCICLLGTYLLVYLQKADEWRGQELLRDFYLKGWVRKIVLSSLGKKKQFCLSAIWCNFLFFLLIYILHHSHGSFSSVRVQLHWVSPPFISWRYKDPHDSELKHPFMAYVQLTAVNLLCPGKADLPLTGLSDRQKDV